MPTEPSTDLRVVERLQVLDPNGIPSSLIIRKGDPFQVAIEFEVLAAAAKAVLCALAFEVKYFAESLGPGPEKVLGSFTRNTVAGQSTYNATTPAGATTTLTVPGNTLPPGVYRLAAMVTFKVRCPGSGAPQTPYPLNAFVEGRAIEIAP
ncbi:hypothetical protein [Streptomyces sp. NBC_01451]|uniref:hypothetical protein n=1 Tax=Streptomyces sp. NBC_01451 TaxID=2903872 RepID=UPI002E31E613|nr:hypothetical protein [Streptomyces sp. NBC_01451]